MIQNHYGLNSVIATMSKNGEKTEYKLTSVHGPDKLEKFMEDVK